MIIGFSHKVGSRLILSSANLSADREQQITRFAFRLAPALFISF